MKRILLWGLLVLSTIYSFFTPHNGFEALSLSPWWWAVGIVHVAMYFAFIYAIQREYHIARTSHLIFIVASAFCSLIAAYFFISTVYYDQYYSVGSHSVRTYALPYLCTIFLGYAFYFQKDTK